MTGIGRSFKPLTWLMAMLLPALVAGCGGGGGGSSGPAAANPVGAVCTQGAACVDLASAGTYVILAQSGVSNSSTSAVTGNIGVSPVTSTALTGFSETLDASGTFSTSAQVTGKLYAADYAAPTPNDLTTAVNDSITAYGDAAGRPLVAPETADSLGAAGEIGGLTIAPGVHKWTSNVAISTDVTLSGTATDVWIFQISGTLTQANGIKVILAGGAQAKNIFWQVGGSTAIGTTAQFKGIIITGSNVAMATGATIDGRLYTGTAVTLDANTVTRP